MGTQKGSKGSLVKCQEVESNQETSKCSKGGWALIRHKSPGVEYG